VLVLDITFDGFMVWENWGGEWGKLIIRIGILEGENCQFFYHGSKTILFTTTHGLTKASFI
jgi:hypothetical protein